MADKSTGDIAGYARILIRSRVQDAQSTRFFGKPYLKLGQCYLLWSYFFQLGCILGSRHSRHIDAFVHAMFGVRESASTVISDTAARLVPESVDGTLKFSDYPLRKLMESTGTNDLPSFMTKAGMSKLDSESAIAGAWLDALDGAAIGAIHPDLVREMFVLSHAPRSKENWDRARNAGLDLPEEQDLMTYEELEEAENVSFMHYCKECCPDLYAILSAE